MQTFTLRCSTAGRRSAPCLCTQHIIKRSGPIDSIGNRPRGIIRYHTAKSRSKKIRERAGLQTIEFAASSANLFRRVTQRVLERTS